MRTAELTGALLDYWVARAEGWTFGPQHKTLECDVWRDADGCIVGTIPASAFKPSTDWAQGGPIIERERMNVTESRGVWSAYDGARGLAYGPTPLVAAMRAYVASKFGGEVPDEVELPASPPATPEGWWQGGA